MKLWIFAFVLSFFSLANAQLQVQDTISASNNKRFKTIVYTETAVASLTLIGLNKLWYSDYPKSKFHFINDNKAWLQMDKMGHFSSSYYMGALGASTMQWAGATQRKKLLFGATTGLAFLTVVEVFDGYSSEWGASVGDVVANTLGTSLYISQDLLWQEQRIVPKYSFHATAYAPQRPAVLGANFVEQMLKDYNGQTYWLSANVKSFFPKTKLPNWLNVAFGYGAEGMLTAYKDTSSDQRYRQYYLSLDVDFTKIKTQSKLLKTIFKLLNIVKIPAPTLLYDKHADFQVKMFYF